MSPELLQLTAAALAGIAARNRGGHGIPVRPAEQIGIEAAELGVAALAALEERATEPGKAPAKPKR